jgi:hypothetical protein
MSYQTGRKVEFEKEEPLAVGHEPKPSLSFGKPRTYQTVACWEFEKERQTNERAGQLLLAYQLKCSDPVILSAARKNQADRVESRVNRIPLRPAPR